MIQDFAYIIHNQCKYNTHVCFRRLTDGDCGSIVYVTTKNGSGFTQMPFGMLIGAFVGPTHRKFWCCDVYQAIILPHAIADLEAEYPGHVKELYQYAHDKHQIASSPVDNIISQLDCRVNPPDNLLEDKRKTNKGLGSRAEDNESGFDSQPNTRSSQC